MRAPWNLRAFQLVNKLALQVYRETTSFPREELFGLASQVRRTAVSVGQNIAKRCDLRTNVDLLDSSTGQMVHCANCNIKFLCPSEMAWEPLTVFDVALSFITRSVSEGFFCRALNQRIHFVA